MSVLRAGTDTVGARADATPNLRRAGAIRCLRRPVAGAKNRHFKRAKSEEPNESGIFGLSEGLLGQRGGLRRRPTSNSWQARRPSTSRSAGRSSRAIDASRFTGAKGQSLTLLGQSGDIARLTLLGVGKSRELDARSAEALGGLVAAEANADGPEGGDRRRRSGQGQPTDARPDRGAHRARRAAAQLPLRQVQDQGQARAEELAGADHGDGGGPGRGAPRLRAARAHHRRGVLHPRPGERAGQRPLSRGVRAPRTRAHQARRQGRDPGRGRDEEARHERAAGRGPGQRARIAAPGDALDERARRRRSRSR